MIKTLPTTKPGTAERPRAEAAFAAWWRRSYGTRAPLSTFRQIFFPLAVWILQAQCKHPSRLFVFGVNGPIGSGKSTLCAAVELILNRLLGRQEGRALSLSLDDYYLPRAGRLKSDFLQQGYNPEGIPNRGPAGTHDTRRLERDLRILGRRRPGASLGLPVFDKARDDRSPRARPFRGKVAVVLLEGWFVGAETRVAWKKCPQGLKRSVARALPRYRAIFNRLDALWAFDPLPLKKIVAHRQMQERTLARKTGRRGMTPQQIRRFVRYFYQDAWTPGVTSPVPPSNRITFRAKVDSSHRIQSPFTIHH